MVDNCRRDGTCCKLLVFISVCQIITFALCLDHYLYLLNNDRNKWNYTKFNGVVSDYVITYDNNLYFLNLNITKTQGQQHSLTNSNTSTTLTTTNISNVSHTLNNANINNANENKCVYYKYDYSNDYDALKEFGRNLLSDYFKLSLIKGTNECVAYKSFKIGKKTATFFEFSFLLGVSTTIIIFGTFCFLPR